VSVVGYMDRSVSSRIYGPECQ